MSQYRQGPANRRQPPPQKPSARPPVPQKKKTSSSRITTSLVALSSGAILSVYALGYARTQQASAQITGQDSSSALAAGTPTVAAPLPRVGALVPGAATPGAATPGAARPGATSTATSGAPPTRPAATATPAAKTGTYRDGTYVGSGTSRHGGVQVTVVVQGGQIVSANITSCQTRYPCSYITSLTGQVVSRQGPPVNLISGATDSSTAYKQAVIQALSKAS
jgi:uncharacterized protein with FMN-binding domain